MRAGRSGFAGLAGVAALILLVALLLSCSALAPVRSSHDGRSGRPPFEEAARVLAACLPAGATPAVAAHLLTEWQLIDDEWGGVSQADVLPRGGPELLVRYHAGLAEASWNPQGKFVVLQQQGGAWQVAFELDGGALGIQDAYGAPWTSWSYHILETADLTGDGLDDVIAELRYSNGLHVAFRYLALLTAHPDSGTVAAGEPAGLRVAYLEDTARTRPVYRLVDLDHRDALQSVISVREQSAITRTLAFDGGVFRRIAEEINPAASTVSAETPDGARWYGFDTFDGGGGSSMYDPVLGLYRLEEGQLQHFDMPGTVRALKVGPDGALYAAGGLGVMRYRDDRWETLMDTRDAQELAAAPFVPFDLAFGSGGELWVAGIHSVARFKDGAWTQIAMPSRRLLVAPDGTVWTEGWDGRAGSDCCFNHLTGSTWVTYTHSVALPVARALQERIRALQR